jgi:uncharacterized radical SAM superfamily protein
MDLVYLSGVLDRADFYLDCIDAIADGLTPAETQERVVRFQPSVLIYLISSPSYDEDVPFLTGLKKALPNTTFIGIGDVYRDMRELGLTEHPFCDAILTDFSTTDLVRWLRRESDTVFDNIIYTAKDGSILSGAEKHAYGFFSIPVPRWDLWHLDRYSFPFCETPRWATVLTDFGCPFSCTFCPMSTTGYKLRDLDTVMDEIRLLRSLGIDEVFFRDQTFGVNRARTTALLKRIREEQPDLKWICWSRVDLVNDEFLRTIAEAGCHTIMFGIETANEDILKKMRKNTKRAQIESALALAKKHGLRTVGTLIVGFPGESEDSIRQTIDYVCRLPLDYASFNIATPRLGTRFRKAIQEQGIIDKGRLPLDSSHIAPDWRGSKEETLAPTVIQSLHRLAIRRFYLRPFHLMRRLVSVKSFYQMKMQMMEAFDLLFPRRGK